MRTTQPDSTYPEPGRLRRLRRRILTPDVSEISLKVRGFHEKCPQARELLETVGASFLTGYGYAAEARTTAEAEERLETVQPRFRGFAYEGAAMAFTVRDGLPFGRSDHLARLLAGRGDDHVYMVYVGVGWAMARLPRFRWSKAHAPDRLLRWLALDGYGFHQAYFHTRRYVDGQYRAPAFPWPADGEASYRNRAIDQGIGRAMWFVAGTDVDIVTSMIEGFVPERQGDLYAGAGLAITYAGGADDAELRKFWLRAGEHRSQVAQGSAFGAEARLRAGLLVPHVERATDVLCGMAPKDAALVCVETLPEAAEPPGTPGPPAYELWRQRVADRFATLGKC